MQEVSRSYQDHISAACDYASSLSSLSAIAAVYKSLVPRELLKTIERHHDRRPTNSGDLRRLHEIYGSPLDGEGERGT